MVDVSKVKANDIIEFRNGGMSVVQTVEKNGAFIELTFVGFAKDSFPVSFDPNTGVCLDISRNGEETIFDIMNVD